MKRIIKLCGWLITASMAMAALTGCGQSAPDVHDEARDTKPYETVELKQLDLEQIVQHLNTLLEETESATNDRKFGEMHHLEIALTSAIERLSEILPEDKQEQAYPIIQDLKTIASKFHIAGHDRNETMARKASDQLRLKANQLIAYLSSQ